MLSEQMALMRSCYCEAVECELMIFFGNGAFTHGVLSFWGRFALCTDGADESRY